MPKSNCITCSEVTIKVPLEILLFRKDKISGRSSSYHAAWSQYVVTPLESWDSSGELAFQHHILPSMPWEWVCIMKSSIWQIKLARSFMVSKKTWSVLSAWQTHNSFIWHPDLIPWSDILIWHPDLTSRSDTPIWHTESGWDQDVWSVLLIQHPNPTSQADILIQLSDLIP